MDLPGRNSVTGRLAVVAQDLDHRLAELVRWDKVAAAAAIAIARADRRQ
jgi:hypothetical protein